MEWQERMATASLLEQTQITSAVTSPTPAGSPIVSLTTTQTTPTTSATACAITANDELLRTLIAMAQQNAELPHELIKEFEKAVKPLFDVHCTAAQKALGPSSGSAKGQPLPPSGQRSPVGTTTDSS